MEQFFEKLKTERESDIIKVKEVFSNQAILLEDLIETGELAITDQKLKEYGITQGRLRTLKINIYNHSQLLNFFSAFWLTC
jgi:hypothetical protein